MEEGRFNLVWQLFGMWPKGMEDGGLNLVSISFHNISNMMISFPTLEGDCSPKWHILQYLVLRCFETILQVKKYIFLQTCLPAAATFIFLNNCGCSYRYYEDMHILHCTVLKSYEVRAKRFMNAVPTRPQATSVSVKGAAESLAKLDCAFIPYHDMNDNIHDIGVKKTTTKRWTWTTTSAFGEFKMFQTTSHFTGNLDHWLNRCSLRAQRSYWEGWQPWQISTCEPICRHDSLEDEPWTHPNPHG